jgi:CRP-like cAMP-binding protein
MKLPSKEKFDVRSFLAAIGASGKSTHYRKRQVIISQGDLRDSMFYIKAGSVKLTVVSRQGKEAIVSVANPGMFFGESCLSLSHPECFHSAIAITEVELVIISGAHCRQVLQMGGNASLNFVSLVLRRSAEIQEDLGNRLVESSEQSLTRVVSSFLRFRSTTPQGELPPKLSQQTLAQMIGVSRQHVNTLMKRIGKEKVGGAHSVSLPKSS